MPQSGDTCGKKTLKVIFGNTGLFSSSFGFCCEQRGAGDLKERCKPPHASAPLGTAGQGDSRIPGPSPISRCSPRPEPSLGGPQFCTVPRCRRQAGGGSINTLSSVQMGQVSRAQTSASEPLQGKIKTPTPGVLPQPQILWRWGQEPAL